MNKFIRAFGWNTVHNDPSEAVQMRVATEAQDHLLGKFDPGHYTDRDQINAVLQATFQFYSERAKRLVKKLASREFMEFILYQYELTTEFRNSELNEEQRALWDEDGPQIRRALKYLAEQTVLRSPPAATVISENKLKPTVDEAILCALRMVSLDNSSDVTHGLFPDHITMEVLPRGNLHLYSIELNEPFSGVFVEFHDRIRRHIEHQNEYTPIPTIDVDPAIQCSILDPHFKRGFGISYNDFCGILTHVISDPLPLPTGYPIPFCHLEKIIHEIAKNGFPKDLVRRIVAGFTLWKSEMLTEQREMWNVKQHHRAFRRPLFEFPHELGTHLVWSKGMAKESFFALLSGATFQKLPVEWLIPDIQAGLSELSNQTGLWFERVATENLSRVGLTGTKYKTHIPVLGGLLEIPSSVGEIDFLGGVRDQNLIILAEFKMVEMATEPRFYRDDVSRFIGKSNSYANRFQRKIDWIWERREALGAKFDMESSVVRLAPVLLTMYPTFASRFISAFPCVSLTEFMLDFQQKEAWPYSIGILPDG